MASPATAPQSLPSLRSGSDVGLARVHRLVARRLLTALDIRGVPAAAVARERDSLRCGRQALPTPPAGRPHDRPGTTRRADQGNVLPVCRDQRQCFRRPILLDAESPHACRAPPTTKSSDPWIDTATCHPPPGASLSR